MSTPILTTKLYLPLARSKIVSRPHLVERLNEGFSSGRKLTLIAAPAGFGKTTLVSEWVADCGHPVAWFSLDKGDNDPARFLTYLISALQTLVLSEVEGITQNMGAGLLSVLQSPQPSSTESILTTLLNEITTIPDHFMLVLDDYHLVDSKPVDEALTFLLEHLPPQMHLVITTREDPQLPLSRFRARGQLTELRAADLRFSPSEAAEFLTQVMDLDLSAEDIAALETRTEGWIAGLQLAAISMQGRDDIPGFIQSFTGSHHFVLDYLMEEVLQQQDANIQTFLLHTSILERMCGPLCDAVLLNSSASGQETLEYLERSNLFIIPRDNERRWYRYHHLFAELLRQRLEQSASSGNEKGNLAEYHIRASQWYENNQLMLEAFQHAAAANDIERAVWLMESKSMPLHLPGTATAILNWLESLPTTVLNAQPALWWKQAAMLLTLTETIGVEEKLQATEAALAAAALPGAELDDKTRNLIGKIAVARALLAQTQYEAETSLVQARRALEYLHPNNLAYRSTATQVMGFAYYLQGDRAEAGRAYTEALAIAQAGGDTDGALMATTRLGQIQELRNQLDQAAVTYQRALQLIGDYPPSNAAVVYLGLARINYEWNDLEMAEQYGEKSLQLARQYDQVIDRLILSELFLARLKLARGDVIGAAGILSQTEQTTRQKNFSVRLPEIAAAQVDVLLRQGNLAGAAHLVQIYNLPIRHARVHLAQGDPSAALALLELFRQQMETKDWQDQRLKAMVVQTVALQAQGEKDQAGKVLGEALALAEPGGFIRLFVDEGEPLRLLLADFRVVIEEQSRKRDHPLSDYVDRLLAAFNKPAAPPKSAATHQKTHQQEPLSKRELEVLKLLRSELSGPEIAQQLIVSLNTLRTHTNNIFSKLSVNNRRAAVRRAEELDLL